MSVFTDPADPLISADFTGWVQRTRALVGGYWRPLLTLQLVGAAAGLVVRVPAGIAQTLGAPRIPQNAPVGSAAAWEATRRGLPALTAGLAGTVVGGLIVALVTVACVRLLVTAVSGGPVSVGAALAGASGRLAALVGWSLLAGVLLLAGICACVLPGLYFAAVFSVLPAIVLFERGGVVVRAFRLFHAEVGAAVLRVAAVLAVVIAAVLVGDVLSTTIHAVTGAAGSAAVAGTVLAAVLTALVQAGAGVVVAPMVLTTYADERARREPLTTMILMHELTTPADAP